MSREGFVHIVGAGPGDPDLMTIRAMNCLREADVVLHDRLIDPRILDNAHPDAEVINVGKTIGDEDLQQERIHWLMIQKVREGNRVCRLKGGDPFVFGRGGEEAQALRAAGISYEIIPGVSSALGVPASVGIPVTHRNRAHSFMVIAGSRSHDLNSPEWTAARDLVKAGGTVVVLMGLKRIKAIVNVLLAGDCPRSTPVAIISNGTRPDQSHKLGTLEGISNGVGDLRSPAVIVIGEVVSISPMAATEFLTAINTP